MKHNVAFLVLVPLLDERTDMAQMVSSRSVRSIVLSGLGLVAMCDNYVLVMYIDTLSSWILPIWGFPK